MTDRENGVGLKVITDIVINRSGINHDDMLLARTCRRCNRLMLDCKVTDIRENNNFLIILKVPSGGISCELKGAEILAAKCPCGAYYSIILYEPVYYYGAGIMAYTVIQLDKVKRGLSNKLYGIKEKGGEMPDLEEWVADTLTGSYNDVVQAVNKTGVTLTEEDWMEAKYSTGWLYR